MGIKIISGPSITDLLDSLKIKKGHPGKVTFKIKKEKPKARARNLVVAPYQIARTGPKPYSWEFVGYAKVRGGWMYVRGEYHPGGARNWVDFPHSFITKTPDDF